MTDHSSPASPAAPPASEVRLSTVVGDRLCIRCNFNLAGQPVVREPHYGMPIVRCPECSTVASLQEYPLLGKWAGRLAAAIAAVWLLIMVGGTFGTAGIMFGMTQGCLDEGSRRLATHIAVAHKEWYDTASESERAAIARIYPNQAIQARPEYWIDAAWWSRQDPSAMVAALGGTSRAIDRAMAEPLFWGCSVTLLLGILWSIFLLHAKRGRLFLFALIPLALAWLFAYIAATSPSRAWMWAGAGTAYPIHEARKLLWQPILIICLTAMFLAFCVGAWCGRPLIRLFARLLLPPRMLGSLSFLWIAERKSPPRPRR